MHRGICLLTLSLLAGSASAQTLQVRPSAAAQPNPALSLAAGTPLMVRLDKPLDPSSAILGQSWTGTLVNDIPIGDHVGLKHGTPVDGLVVSVKRGGHLHGGGSLGLRMIRVNDAAVATNILTRDKEGHWNSGVTKVGGGSALGAAIGGLTGGVAGALVGGAAGAAGGAVATAAGGHHDAPPAVSAETVLTFTVQ